MADADLNLWEFIIAVVLYQAIVTIIVYLAARVVGALAGEIRRTIGIMNKGKRGKEGKSMKNSKRCWMIARKAT